MNKTTPLVAVVMGSTSDADIMKGSMEQLKQLGIPYEVKITSAHRTPHQTKEYVETAMERGIEVFIAGAGWSAHLAGVIAAYTTLPVIGVPIDSSVLQGMDALLSTVQMPPGIPVATVAIGKGGAKNAAILAAQILSLKYPDIALSVKKFREDLTKEAVEKGSNWRE
ncbi:MAG: 5-(carboxyamino)imidazole ribonucleotide mutase [Deltaproteobacteria bacterium]|nr:5-(carboxyamino)imidazole ribonucleotide mutase [Deltaproteobacteria bacterium]